MGSFTALQQRTAQTKQYQLCVCVYVFVDVRVMVGTNLITVINQQEKIILKRNTCTQNGWLSATCCFLIVRPPKTKHRSIEQHRKLCGWVVRGEVLKSCTESYQHLHSKHSLHRNWCARAYTATNQSYSGQRF